MSSQRFPAKPREAGRAGPAPALEGNLGKIWGQQKTSSVPAPIPASSTPKHPRRGGAQFSPVLSPVISIDLGWGEDGGKRWQKSTSWERNGAQVKPSPKPALDPSPWINSRERRIYFGQSVVLKFLLDFAGCDGQRWPLFQWKPGRTQHLPSHSFSNAGEALVPLGLKPQWKKRGGNSASDFQRVWMGWLIPNLATPPTLCG